jgi:hypothetical protein
MNQPALSITDAKVRDEGEAHVGLTLGLNRPTTQGFNRVEVGNDYEEEKKFPPRSIISDDHGDEKKFPPRPIINQRYPLILHSSEAPAVSTQSTGPRVRGVSRRGNHVHRGNNRGRSGRLLNFDIRSDQISAGAPASAPTAGRVVGPPLIRFRVGMFPADESQCVICMEDYKVGEALRPLSTCYHRYHEACINTWLTVRPTCPSCNRRVEETVPPASCSVAPVAPAPAREEYVRPPPPPPVVVSEQLPVVMDADSTGALILSNYENRKYRVWFKRYEFKYLDFIGLWNNASWSGGRSHSDVLYVSHLGAHCHFENIAVHLPSTIVDELGTFWSNSRRSREEYGVSVVRCKRLASVIKNMTAEQERLTVLYAPAIALLTFFDNDQNVARVVEGDYYLGDSLNTSLRKSNQCIRRADVALMLLIWGMAVLCIFLAIYYKTRSFLNGLTFF